MKKFVAMTALALVSVLQGTSAHAAFVGDRMNLLAPALYQTDSGNPTVVVRGANGNIFAKILEPNPLTWVDMGAPSVGASSGPQMVDFKDSNNNITTFIFVRGGDGNLWGRSRTTGAWSAWSKTFNAPSSGANSAYTVESDQFYGLLVGVLDNNNMPLMSPAFSSGGGFQPWQSVGSNPLDATFGLAIQPGPQSIIAWGIVPADADHIDWSICGFPTCFNGWNNTPGGSARSGLATTGFIPNGGGSSTMVAVRGGDDRVWTNAINNGGSPVGWAQAPGFTTDAMPAIARSAFSSGILIVYHRNDGSGNYYLGTQNILHP